MSHRHSMKQLRHAVPMVATLGGVAVMVVGLGMIIPALAAGGAVTAVAGLAYDALGRI